MGEDSKPISDHWKKNKDILRTTIKITKEHRKVIDDFWKLIYKKKWKLM